MPGSVHWNSTPPSATSGAGKMGQFVGLSNKNYDPPVEVDNLSRVFKPGEQYATRLQVDSA